MNNPYQIYKITPMCDFGEIKALMNGSDGLNEKGWAVIRSAGLSAEEVDSISYSASFHPESRDVHIRIIWTSEEDTHSKSMSLPSRETDLLIQAISHNCQEVYGVSVNELLSAARKEEERDRLQRFSF